MTSQPRMRRTNPLAGDGSPRARATIRIASGDSAPCNGNFKQSAQRSRSKNKLPKNIRYDLENALVGTHARLLAEKLCENRDEYSAEVCELCRLLFNAANSIKSAVSQASSAAADFAASTAAAIIEGHGNAALETKQLQNSGRASTNVSQQHGLRLKPRSKSTQPHHWRVPRPCRTNSTIPSIAAPRTRMNLHSAPRALINPDMPPPLPMPMSPAPLQTQKSKIVDKWTQTPYVRQLYVSRGISPEIGVHLGTTTCKPQPHMQQGILPECGRCPGTTNLFRSRVKKYNNTLFDDDLIEAIATKYENDKGIHVLYQRSSGEYPSSMNIAAKLKIRYEDGNARKRPWR